MKRALLALALLFWGAGAAQAAEAGFPDTIRFGYQPSHVLIVVAKAQGLLEKEFAKEGVGVEYQKFLAGPPIIEAFAGDRLDFGTTGDQPAIQARANNIDIKAIGVYAAGSRNYGLVVPPGSDIKSVKDLKGKKVGVTVGSIAHQLLFLYLDSAGLSPKDLQIVNLLPPDLKTALAQKNIDALVTWDPYISVMENEGVGVHVQDATGFKNIINVLFVSQKFAKAHPDVVRRMLKVYVQTLAFIRDNPQQTVEIVARETGFKPEVLAKSIPRIDFDLRLTDEAVQSIADTAKFLRESGVIRRDVAVSDLVDASYLKDIGAQ